MIIQTEYRRIGYKLSDAFHRDPKFNKRIFLVDTKRLGTECIDSITIAAKETAPEGYEFYRCRRVK